MERAAEEMMTRAVFLDRDGVINRKRLDDRYITCWEEFEFLPAVAESIMLLNRAGFFVVVVTNQRCVAKGLITEAELEGVHRRMVDALKNAGANVDGIYYCPHETDPPCGCRKPAPGMLQQAARVQNIELLASWMIGDSDADISAGRAAGCRTARILSKSENLDGVQEADIVACSLLDATRQILRWEGLTTDALYAAALNEPKLNGQSINN
jgi:D-glycero-D-manno-heptose 1,7-bisphosphate phosphatase